MVDRPGPNPGDPPREPGGAAYSIDGTLRYAAKACVDSSRLGQESLATEMLGEAVYVDEITRGRTIEKGNHFTSNKIARRQRGTDLCEYRRGRGACVHGQVNEHLALPKDHQPPKAVRHAHPQHTPAAGLCSTYERLFSGIHPSTTRRGE